MEEKYGKAAKLAEEAGFDGVDIKCCHGYLMSELMGAFLREGAYGGSFENRTRLFFNAIEQAKQNTGKDFIVTSRMNAYDGFPYPYGFGVSESSGTEPDLSETLQVVSVLKEKYHFSLLDITIGNPYVNPHVNRPFNHGPYESPEEPLIGVERMMQCVGAVQRANPDMVIMGSGFSYMGAESANVAAGAVENGVCKIAGFGRQAFAYPDFAKDAVHGGLHSKKCCIACGKCSELMRADLLSMTEESYDFVMDINTKGTFFLTQAVANHMIENKNAADRYIVNISSLSAYATSVNRGEYCISKAGVSMITKLFADRLAREGIVVNEIRPGIIRTGMTATVQKKYDDLIDGGLLPICRWGEPCDIAQGVYALCSGALPYVTGQSLDVDGGYHIQRL